jgi:hypothetical protein
VRSCADGESGAPSIRIKTRMDGRPMAGGYVLWEAAEQVGLGRPTMLTLTS